MSKKVIIPLSNRQIVEAGTKGCSKGMRIAFGIASTLGTVTLMYNAYCFYTITNESEVSTRAALKLACQENRLIHSDSWYLWAGAGMIFPLGMGLVNSCAKGIQGRVFGNVRRINYRPQAAD